MKLVFVANNGIVLRTDEEKWEHREMTREQRKLTFYIYRVKKLKFDVVTEYLSDIAKKKGGVYFLCNKKGFLLNIGQTYDLYYRIYRKLYGKTGGSTADEHFYRFYSIVKLYYIESLIDRMLCEIYFINTKRPKLNYHYAYYPNGVYKTLTNEFKEKGSKAIDEFVYLFKILSGE